MTDSVDYPKRRKFFSNGDAIMSKLGKTGQK